MKISENEMKITFKDIPAGNYVGSGFGTDLNLGNR